MGKALQRRRPRRMRRMSSLLCVLFLSIAWQESASAQTGNQGSLGGMVRAPRGAAGGGARMVARNRATDIAATHNPSSHGVFEFPAIRHRE